MSSNEVLEFEDEFEDEEDDYEVEESGTSELDYYSLIALQASKLVGQNKNNVRFELCSQRLNTLAQSRGMTFDTLISSSSSSDEGYNLFVEELYPNMETVLGQVLDGTHREVLVTSFGLALNDYLWSLVEKVAKSKGVAPAAVLASATSNGLHSKHFNSGLPVSDFIQGASTQATNESPMEVIESTFSLLEVIKETSPSRLELPQEENTPDESDSEDDSESEEAEEVAPEPEEEEEDEFAHVDMMEVKAIVQGIMNIYDKLYAPCFVNKPQGILTHEGVLTIGKDGKTKILSSGSSYAKRLYSAFNRFTGDYIRPQSSTKSIDSSFLDTEGNLLDVYSPMYHVRNIYGIKHDGSKESNWGKFRNYLQKDITQLVTSVLSKIEGDTIHVQRALKELFTNCIIIEDFDMTKSLQLTTRLEGLKPRLGDYLNENSYDLFATSTGKIISEQEDEVSVRNLLYVFDENAYTNEILFAYKAYEKLMRSGINPSAKAVVLGRGLDGKDITENLDDAGNIIIGIIAGSRSGKGVVTLSILASLYADNCPVYYVDYKPDMAATLWETERELNAKGLDAKIFAIDGLADQRSDSGELVKPVRKFPYGLNAPDGLGWDTKDKAIVPYLKAMQLSAVLAQLRSNGRLDNKDKMFFVLDEAQKANSRYAMVLSKMVEFENRNKPKRNEEPTEEYLYASRFIQVFQHDLKDAMGGVMNTTGGAGRVGLVVLGQKADPAEWKLGDLGDWRKGVFGNLVANMNIKLIGRDSGNSGMYGMPNKKFAGSEFKNNRGYFIRYRGSKTPEDLTNLDMIKTYLVLNKNDFNEEAYRNGSLDKSTFTGSLLTNITDTTLKESIVTDDFLEDDGSVRDSIGFSGLMKMIMGSSNDSELSDKMSKGYKILEEVFTTMGLSNKYSCVEEYLYDCSLESLYSVSDLEDMFITGSPSSEGDEESEDEEEVDWFQRQESPVSTNTTSAPIITPPLPLPHSEDSDNELESEGVSDVWESQAEEEEPGDFEQQVVHERQPDPDLPPPPPIDHIVDDPYVPTTDRPLGYDNAYTEPLSMPNNPFKMLSRSNGGLSTMCAIRLVTEELMKKIRDMVGDYSRIESLEITETGLVINNIAFRPTFSQDLIDSMPFDMRQRVAQGNVVDFFNFDAIYKFKNLMTLRIDNSNLAEGRVRREMGIPLKTSWYILFRKFRSLQELYIGGERITDEDTAYEYDERGRGGYTLKEKLREKFSLPESTVRRESRMDRAWRSKPAKVATGALGATMGVKAVAVGATIFGGWALLFGAFAGYGAYRHLKNRD